MRSNQSALERHDFSIYVHYPFCIKKCPYCDFASQVGNSAQRDKEYIDLLIREFKLKEPFIKGRKAISLYIGGGTPSLCDSNQLARLLETVSPYLAKDAEISLEANPGTVDLEKFKSLRQIGFNRISIGVQSFDDRALKRLGRIHSAQDAIEACENVVKAQFDNFNIDLMHGLPSQTPQEALSDLKQAIALNANHLSWYELTIEEDTYFGMHPPKLPDEDVLYNIEQQGFELLEQNDFIRYEVSGYHKKNTPRCLHNQNYWLFGDYLGLGAAAHQKLTYIKEQYTDFLNNDDFFVKVDEQKDSLLNLQKAMINHEKDSLYVIERSANSEDFDEYRQSLFQLNQNIKTLTDAQLNQQIEIAQSLNAQVIDDNDDEFVKGRTIFSHVVDEQQVSFEYMLNRMRLHVDDVKAFEYLLHTGQNIQTLKNKLEKCQQLGLIELDLDLNFKLTPKGKLMTSNAISCFL